jgi:putative solute:sodium symporter small subunit
MNDNRSHSSSHWRSTLKATFMILGIWFFVSFGCSILFRTWMDENMPTIGNAPFGFWMAQQGSILFFVILLVAYSFWMNKLDKSYGYSKENH